MNEENDPGRLPAQNIEAEERVLGAVLLDNEVIIEVQKIIKPSDFYKPSNATIFESMIRLHGSGDPIDYVSLVDDLKKNDVLEFAGGEIGVLKLSAEGGSPKRALFWSRIIKQESTRRNQRMVAQELLEMAEDPTIDPAELSQLAVKAIQEGAEGIEKWKSPGRKRGGANKDGKSRQGGRASARIFQEKDAPTKFSEDETAHIFKERNEDMFKFIPQRGIWMGWNASHWDMDELGKADEAIRMVCRERSVKFLFELRAANLADGPARQMGSSRFINGVNKIASKDSNMVVSITDLDKDEHLLGTPNGVIDLRTGKMREAKREDYITRTTAVAPGGSRENWEKFLVDATGEDGDLSAYLRRMAGYCLSGSVRDHVAFFFVRASGGGQIDIHHGDFVCDGRV